MKVVTSARRQVIMATLLGLALVGAAMRHWAANPSLTRDIGTLLLVLWLPAVGNLVGFVIQKFPRRSRKAPGFQGGAPFTAHLVAEVAALDDGSNNGPRIPAGESQCTLVTGSEGYSARVRLSLQDLQAIRAPQMVEFELLRPQVALDRLADGTDFHLLCGRITVAKGTVKSRL